MILAIVGSTCAREEDVIPIVHRIIQQYRPRAVVSGGAEGVDSIAERVAKLVGLPVIECQPARKEWACYRERNILIAELCGRLVRIVSQRSTTYGSGWTLSHARSLGKPVEEIVVP